MGEGKPLTAKAREFVRKNASAAVVSGEWLDKNRRRVTGPPETWVKKRYRFDDMTQITLNEVDLASLKAGGVEPVWWGDRHA